MRITTKQGAIHQSCKRLNISRDELARRMGVSTATAYRVDAGKVDPSPQFIAALMISTGASFEDLFDITGNDAVPAGEPAEALAG